jgi:acetate---CoA ligase (ADP-forming)
VLRFPRALKEAQGARLLKGCRGRPAFDIGALADIILGAARLMEDHPDASELDLNPVILYPHGAYAVDARIVAGQISS